jgi:hypothetical protein
VEPKGRSAYRNPFEKPERKWTSPLILAGLVALIILVIVWAGMSVTVGDALWFYPSFQTPAAVMDLYWDGGKVRLLPGTPGYDVLQQAIFAEFPQVKSAPGGTGLSDETLAELRASGRLLEVYYAEPARVHSWYNFGESEVFYVPLSGFHAKQLRVFNAARGTPLELKSTQQIYAAAEAVAKQHGLMKP